VRLYAAFSHLVIDDDGGTFSLGAGVRVRL
jgi:hypothetical protein